MWLGYISPRLAYLLHYFLLSLAPVFLLPFCIYKGMLGEPDKNGPIDGQLRYMGAMGKQIPLKICMPGFRLIKIVNNIEQIVIFKHFLYFDMIKNITSAVSISKKCCVLSIFDISTDVIQLNSRKCKCLRGCWSVNCVTL